MQKQLFGITIIIQTANYKKAVYRKINSVVQWSENVIFNVFVMKSAIKEPIISIYHHQMVFHIKFTSDILTDMIRMPQGTVDIKKYSLNRLMSHKLKHTNLNNFICF